LLNEVRSKSIEAGRSGEPMGAVFTSVPFKTVLIYWLAILWMFFSGWACADFVLYQLPGSQTTVLLEGKTKSVGPSTFEYTHPTMGTITLSRESAMVIKAPTREEEYRRLSSHARETKAFDDYIQAARFALRSGMLEAFRDCCNAAYKIDPEHPTMLRLLEARRKLRQPLSSQDSEQQGAEAELRAAVPTEGMQIVRSEHYVMLHDTGDTKSGRKRIPRWQARLELLENMYEAFFMKFALEGVVLEIPREPLKVVLFGQEQDYLRYSRQRDASLASALGYWSSEDNIAVFFDQGTTERMRLLDAHAKELAKNKLRARGTAQSRDAAYLANTVELLVKLTRESDDVEVVSHEATHQLAGNTGLMPRGQVALRWAHEGLASYFETSSDSGWGGIGAVNEGRLKSYQRVSSDPQRARVELLITDGLFDIARDTREAADAYGQAWALTHFLMEHHFQALVEYYRQVAELQTNGIGRGGVGRGEGGLDRRELVRLFKERFGQIEALERQWHSHMQTLQTDLDRARAAVRN
jgi:hypothetical protein